MSMYDIDIEVVQHDIGNIAKLQKFTEGSLAKWAIRLGPSFNTNNTFELITFLFELDRLYLACSDLTQLSIWWIVFLTYSVVSIKRTGSLNYFEVFSHPVLFFHVLKKNFAPPCSFFHVLKKNFAPPCSLITSCSLNRYYRVVDN